MSKKDSKEQQKLSLDKEARDIAESIQKSPDRDSINFVICSWISFCF